MSPEADQPILFALESSRTFGQRVADGLGLPLGEHAERPFEDGEHKTQPAINVRNRDVYIIQSLYSDEHESVNDKLCRFLFFLGAVRDASARSVTAVAPYLCYARKDRKTKPRDPVTTRYIAALFEAVGVDRVVTMDVHNLAAFQNAARCRTDHLEAAPLFVEHFRGLANGADVVVASPDVGGVKRAEQFRRALGAATGRTFGSAFMEKRRSGGEVTGDAVVGDVRGKTVILIDDLISSGVTLSRAARAFAQHGAGDIHAAATHGLFVGDANQTMADPAIKQVVVTDTIPPFRLDKALVRKKVTVLEASALFAQAIQCIHSGGSIVELLQP